ncbi:hypothetical protein BGX29_000250 [Mortierella sp. GBA35]|nr:hypothetical protein BGX29_000250 [Mortierella sp. GBA35]
MVRLTISTLLVLTTTAATASFTSAAPVKSHHKSHKLSSSSSFSGKATWFTDSYGSCNYHWDGNGKAVNVRIVDTCPGDECAYGSLDLSPAAFKKIGDLATGILNIEWYYI